MIDPGHPFSVPYETLIRSLEERIRFGVEQPDRARLVFQSSVSRYELPRPAHAVLRVTGMLGGGFTVFGAGEHYRFASNRIVWIHPTEQPDEGSRFEVEFTYRERPAGLTDFNAGSVVGTLVRAVAREMKLLYEQMDQSYRRAFIDVAEGVALDNVVALLGVVRNAPLKARGEVVFLRRSATDRVVVIPENTRVTDESGRGFVTTEAAEILPEKDEFHTQVEGIVRTRDRVAQLVGIWPRGDEPEPATSLPTEPIAPAAPFGEDERTVTLAPGARPTGELRVRFRPKSVRLPVEAVESGPGGNVGAATVVVMPTPPAGVTGVLNERPIEGGREGEPDDQLRVRAKHALERAGNATLNALKFAVLGLERVDGVEVLDHSVDPAIPLGEVRVRFSATDPDLVRPEVRAVVEATRAAGVRALVEVIETILVSGTFYVVPEPRVTAGATEAFRAAVIEAIEALAIGAPLSIRRLNALVYPVGGLADVAEAQLATPAGPAEDPVVIERTQLLRPNRSELDVVLLHGLRVAESRRVGAANELDLELTDTAGEAASFLDVSIDLSISVRAALVTAPDQPPERVASFTRRVRFAGASTATLSIALAEVDGFRAGDHDPDARATLAAAAYPGLAGAEAALDLTP